jgi:hypothetical protein
MIESQLAQLAVVVPLLEKGKIMGQPEDLETTNLVNIYNAANYYIEPTEVKWIDYILPDKKGVEYQNTQGTHQRVKIWHPARVIKTANHKGAKKALTACQPLKA